MNELHTFYKDVLGKLPFSITSYIDAEKEVEAFFNNVCESPIFIGRTHIDFISYALAKLEDPIDFKVANLTKKSIFFNSLNERSLELFLMHDYYNFKYFLADLSSPNAESAEVSKTAETSGNGSDSNASTLASTPQEPYDANGSSKSKPDADRFFTAEIIAKLFIDGTGFRVKCSTRSHTSVKYDQHLDIITIQIPFNLIFETKSEEKYRDIQSKLFGLYEARLKELGNQLHDIAAHSQLSIRKTGNKFEFKDKKKEEISSELFAKTLLNKDQIGSLQQILFHKLYLLNTTNDNGFFGRIENQDTEEEGNTKTKRAYLREFVNLIISQGFSSFLFNTWIENIPAIVNVDHLTGAKQSLGSLVVGYREKDLSYEERTFLKLISDRVSHLFAAEALYELSVELRYKKKRRLQVDWLNDFRKNVLHSDIHHGGRPVNADDVELLNTFLGKYSGEQIRYAGLELAVQFIVETFTPGNTIDYRFFVQLGAPAKKELWEKHNVYRYAKDGDDSQFEGAALLGIEIETGSRILTSPTINVAFAHELIKMLITNAKAGETYVEKAETSTSNSTLLMHLTFRKPIEIAKFFASLTGIDRKPGDLGEFLVKNYDAIKVIGNLDICAEENGGERVLVDFVKDLAPVKDGPSQFPRFETLDPNFLTNFRGKEEFKSLTYRLHYHSA